MQASSIEGVAQATPKKNGLRLLLLPLVILAGIRAGSDPSPATIGVVVGIAALALVAVVATVLESRRIGRRPASAVGRPPGR